MIVYTLAGILLVGMKSSNVSSSVPRARTITSRHSRAAATEVNHFGHIVLQGTWEKHNGSIGVEETIYFDREHFYAPARGHRGWRNCTWQTHTHHYRWKPSHRAEPAAPVMTGPEIRALVPPNTAILFAGDSLSRQFMHSYNARIQMPILHAASLWPWETYAFVVKKFHSSNPKTRQCAEKFRNNPESEEYSVRRSQFTHKEGGQTVHGQVEAYLKRQFSTWRVNGPVDSAVVVVNQAAHLHRIADSVGKCYAELDSATIPAAALVAAQSDVLVWWRAEVEHQAKHFARLCAHAKKNYNITVRVVYRTSPPAADVWLHGKTTPTTLPLPPNADLTEAYKAPGTRDGIEYSHNIFGAVNNMSIAAYLAAGHSVIDVEHMLGMRVDSHPASYTGDECHGKSCDKLHFCEPGPVDFAMDAIIHALFDG